MGKGSHAIWLTIMTFIICSPGFLRIIDAWSSQEHGLPFETGQRQAITNAEKGGAEGVVLWGVDDVSNHIRTANHDPNLAGVEKELQKIWRGVNTAAQNGDIDTLISYFALQSQERYRSTFTQIGTTALPKIFSSIELIHLLNVRDHYAEAEAIRTENGEKFSYPIYFIEEQDGIWKVESM
jgi:hypothetical protein